MRSIVSFLLAVAVLLAPSSISSSDMGGCKQGLDRYRLELFPNGPIDPDAVTPEHHNNVVRMWRSFWACRERLEGHPSPL